MNVPARYPKLAFRLTKGDMVWDHAEGWFYYVTDTVRLDSSIIAQYGDGKTAPFNLGETVFVATDSCEADHYNGTQAFTDSADMKARLDAYISREVDKAIYDAEQDEP